MSTPKKQNQAYIGLVLATLIIGLSFIFVKIGLRYAGAMDLLAHRFTAAAISIVILWIFGFIKLPRFSFKKAKSLLLLSLFYPLLFFALQTFGLQHSTASEAGIIFAATPIITLIAASFFLKEKNHLVAKDRNRIIHCRNFIYHLFYGRYVWKYDNKRSNTATIVCICSCDLLHFRESG